MSRFDRIYTPRLQVEVNLPNYDLRKSMAAAAKRQERIRKNRNRAAEQSSDRSPPPDPEPVQLGHAQQTHAHEQLPAEEVTPIVINL